MTEHELLRRLRDMAADTTVPDDHDMEARLLAAFDTVPRRPGSAPSPRFARDYFWTAATALLLVSGALVWHLAAQNRVANTNAATIPSEDVLEFVALPGFSGLPDLEIARIVRVELPLAALPAYGLEMVPDAVDNGVSADLLVGQDGVARGIRLIP